MTNYENSNDLKLDVSQGALLQKGLPPKTGPPSPLPPKQAPLASSVLVSVTLTREDRGEEFSYLTNTY